MINGTLYVIHVVEKSGAHYEKITGVIKAKGFEDCNFEFYVDDNMTEKQIEMEVYQRAGFSLDWTEEDGYEPYTVTMYRKKRDE